MSEILLESGTGELELLEFCVNGVHYGINVIKVKEILDIDYFTKVPNSDKSILGLTLVRGDIITLIDLKQVLSQKQVGEKFKTILSEFNKLKIAFCVDEIKGIHRIGWSSIKKPENLMEDSLVIGNIVLTDRIVMLLDFEKIIMDLNPKSGINEDRLPSILIRDRSEIKVILADDSSMIRRVLKNTLTKAGFEQLKFFDDGKEAYDYLFELKEEKGKNFIEDVHILITDIEMPNMDGHTLTRKIKEDKILKNLPVIIFSSLITDDLRHKGDAVGADAQMSKPDIEGLVAVVDILLKKSL